MTKFERAMLAGVAVIVELLSRILLSLNDVRFGDEDLANAEKFVEYIRSVTNDNDQK